MSTTKITFYEARDIAIAISAKAFEHLLKDPLQVQQNIGHKAYSTLFRKLGATPKALASAGFCTANSTEVEIRNKHGSVQTIEIQGKNLISNSGIHLIVVDDDIFDEATEAQIVIKPLVEKRDDLAQELRDQLTNQSVTKVCKAWPEAASFINEYFNIRAPKEIQRPLEDLLRKFLPALPAPK